MAHPGPSRTIIVEPLTTPARRPRPAEEPARRDDAPSRREPAPPPAPREPVPA